MRVWKVTSLGEPRVALELLDAPIPVPKPGQVVVRVLAAALNFPDVLMCRGEYQVKPPLPFTPGIEVCGEITAVGSSARGVALGNRVIGTPVGGGFAEYALLDAAGAFPAPACLDDAQASSFYVGYQTSWMALHRRTELAPGELLVVHAAAGGVGSSAVQLGKAAGAKVVAVVGSAAKAAVARELGADIVVDRSTEDFVDVVTTVTGGRGAEVIYDPVGGDVYRRSTKCIAFEGRIIVIGFAGGEIQNVGLNHALIKNYSIIGLHWGLYQTKNPDVIRECHQALTDLAESGAVTPLISERVPFDELPGALQRLADGQTVGRLVLVP